MSRRDASGKVHWVCWLRGRGSRLNGGGLIEKGLIFLALVSKAIGICSAAVWCPFPETSSHKVRGLLVIRSLLASP